MCQFKEGKGFNMAAVGGWGCGGLCWGGIWQNEMGPHPGESSVPCRKPESLSNDSHPCRKERVNTRNNETKMHISD